jgi:hypothetical protein
MKNKPMHITIRGMDYSRTFEQTINNDEAEIKSNRKPWLRCIALGAAALFSLAALAADPAAPDLPLMHQQTELMQKQMQEIQQAKTAEERQRLLQEHMQTVREHMHTLCDGNGMMGREGMATGMHKNGDDTCAMHRKQKAPAQPAKN